MLSPNSNAKFFYQENSKQLIACRRCLLLVASLVLFNVPCRRRREQNKNKTLKALYERSNDRCFSQRNLKNFFTTNYYRNIIFNGTFQSSLKIFQWDPLIKATLKCSTKGGVTGAFRRATCTKPSKDETTTEM